MLDYFPFTFPFFPKKFQHVNTRPMLLLSSCSTRLRGSPVAPTLKPRDFRVDDPSEIHRVSPFFWGSCETAFYWH